MYRVFREVLELRRKDARILTLLLFSFEHVLIPTMVPDHFVISLMLLSLTLYITGKKMKKGQLLTALAIVGSNLLYGRNGNIKWGEDPVSRLIHQWKEGVYL